MRQKKWPPFAVKAAGGRKPEGEPTLSYDDEYIVNEGVLATDLFEIPREFPKFTFFAIPNAVLTAKITPLAKILFGVLRWRQGGNRHSWAAIDTLAKLCGASRRGIQDGIGQLERAGLLTCRRRQHESSLYSVKSISDGGFLRLRQELATCGTGAAEALIHAGLEALSRNEDGQSWANQGLLAAWLGISRRTVQLSLTRLKAENRLQIVTRRGRGRTCIYRVITAFLPEKVVLKRPELNAQDLPTIEKNNIEEEISLRKKRIFSEKLSFGKPEPPEKNEHLAAKLNLLRTHGRIHPSVALSLAQEHSLEDVQAALKNALAKEKGFRDLGLPWNKRSGYIVGTLNGAFRERHSVSLSPASRAIIAKAAPSTPGSRKTPDQVRAWVAEQKRLLGVAS